MSPRRPSDALQSLEGIEVELFSQPLVVLVRKLCFFRRLEKLWSLIQRDYSDPQLSLSTAAKEIRISKNHLNVLLRTATNLTFHQLVVRYRLWRAVLMMRKHNYSLLEISLETGFGSFVSFERNFHQLFGERPRELRTRLLGRLHEPT